MPTLPSVACDIARENSAEYRLHERRRTPRTPLYGGSFAVLRSESKGEDTEILAQILDISEQGIAFRCFADASSMTHIKTIDIALPNQGVSLEALPVQAVNETDDRTNANGNRNAGHCSARVRRLGMCFDTMPHHKSEALASLIERFACGRSD
jgi:hypothetical protein